MYQLIIPEILLAICASLLLGFGVSRQENRAPVVRYVAIAILVLYAFMGLILGGQSGQAFKGALIVDDFAHYVKFFLGLSGAAALLLAKDFLEQENLDHYEFSVLLLYSVLGMSIMASSNNMLALYIGVEMQSLALYVMAAFNRDSLRASEAGLKYFVLGALSSGLLLYGISLVYGFTGTLQFNAIASIIETDGITPGIVAGMAFMLCGLGFKISAAPFHMWTPDVYEGSPTPVTGFFATAPKLAAIALITRICVVPFDGITDQWQQVIIVFAVLSMLVGVFGALIQTNIKRLMAYSSIANMGFALVPLAAGGVAGVRGMLIYMSIYIITVIGTFACILQMRIRNGMVENISDLGGLSKSNRSLAILLTMFMFSVAGIPFLAGFFGKYFAFYPAYAEGLVWLVIVALVASVVGAAYYIRIIKVIWFDEEAQSFVKAPRALRGLSLIAGLLVFPLLLLPFVAIPGQSLITAAAQSLF